MRRLERNGIINGYTVSLNSNPNQDYVQCFLQLDIVRSKQSKLIDDLRNFPEIKSCFVVTGICDLICQCEAPQLEDIEALVAELSTNSAVNRIDSSLVMSAKFRRDSGAMANSARLMTGSASRPEV
jgi:DNA-binding Lrp family transcriptional regulator